MTHISSGSSLPGECCLVRFPVVKGGKGGRQSDLERLLSGQEIPCQDPPCPLLAPDIILLRHFVNHITQLPLFFHHLPGDQLRHQNISRTSEISLFPVADICPALQVYRFHASVRDPVKPSLHADEEISPFSEKL